MIVSVSVMVCIALRTFKSHAHGYLGHTATDGGKNWATTHQLQLSTTSTCNGYIFLSIYDILLHNTLGPSGPQFIYG